MVMTGGWCKRHCFTHMTHFLQDFVMRAGLNARPAHCWLKLYRHLDRLQTWGDDRVNPQVKPMNIVKLHVLIIFMVDTRYIYSYYG